MRRMMLALGLTAMVVPTLTMAPVATAQNRYRSSDDRNYRSGDDRDYREYRDRRGRVRCKKKDGTTGLIVGGIGGALLGRTIDTRGDRTIGTLGGAAAGALAGRAIDRGGSNDRRCR